ncbi:MAG: hypothetical protein ACI87E_005135 [Mariniblastus sp.]|jgi:hypothetical protein
MTGWTTLLPTAFFSCFNPTTKVRLAPLLIIAVFFFATSISPWDNTGWLVLQAAH